MSALKIAIIGAKGRMGQMLIAGAKLDSALAVMAAVDVGDDLAKAVAGCDVVIEFALREATLPVAKLAAQYRKPLVIGTTGHSDAEKQAIRDVLKPVPCVWSANYSTGVNTLFWLSGKVAALVPQWECEIVETHHTAKKDAPSGTAKTLQEIIEQARGQAVPAHALRIGDVVGDHTVTFGTAGERVELTHRASSRETFARGALRAAKWVVQQKPGLYDMQDVLGLRCLQL
jgi:4-hydroxy-tetrahydrodipicolinate reductase